MSKTKICAECGSEFTGRTSSTYCSAKCSLWGRIDRSGGPDACWPWKRSLNTDGYAARHVVIDGILTSPHRHVYRLHHGVDPGDLNVCHSCDNPVCNNPRHLWIGTQRQNLEDAIAKGRPIIAGPGVRNRNAKLSDELVRLIRSTAGNTTQLAQWVGVNRATINNVRAGRSWRHVADDDVPVAAE
jgi:hypothetical protein